MGGYTLKRRNNNAGAMVLYRKPKMTYSKAYAKRPMHFTAGKDRVSGYYGRYPSQGGRGELKFHDVSLSDAEMSVAWNVVGSICLIPQGVTEKTRVGRKCTITNINWRYAVALPAVDGASPGDGVSYRVVMYLDKQCNGAAAAATDLFESDDYQSFHNLANSGRFVTLMDRIHHLDYSNLASDAANVVTSSLVVRDYTFFKKCNIPLEFNSTTGAITEIRSNNIGVMISANLAEGAFASKIRLRYRD